MVALANNEQIYQQQQKQQQIAATAATTYSTRTPSTTSTSTTRTLSTTETQRKEINKVENILEPENDEIIRSNDADNPLKLLSSVAVSVREEQNCRPKRNLNEDLAISMFI
ncbi:hypothetical protein Glove_87g105 [Diversispora epigaea]|uniref:Uncharacterized protein n=1 Tax=Diversispora epigaea TaxID=1348612 RepID=A0A397JD40_9GLOM|nr:hypothetical protein Glove_87g105 [Diversispora epigaea]